MGRGISHVAWSAQSLFWKHGPNERWPSSVQTDPDSRKSSSPSAHEMQDGWCSWLCAASKEELAPACSVTLVVKEVVPRVLCRPVSTRGWHQRRFLLVRQGPWWVCVVKTLLSGVAHCILVHLYFEHRCMLFLTSSLWSDCRTFFFF